MPGTNAGTGYPLTLRCAKCRKRLQPIRTPPKGYHLAATGRVKRARRRGIRQTNRRIQIRCLDCGHLGWTQHEDAERLLAAYLDAEAHRATPQQA